MSRIPIRSKLDPLSFLRNKPTQEEPTIEQIRKVIELAEKFDKLQHTPGWEDVLRYMGTEVNAQLTEATSYRLDSPKKATCVERWDAKRELLDNLLGWIEAQQTERNRIVEEAKRGREDNRGAT